MLQITLWEDIYFDEGTNGFESLIVMDNDLGFGEQFHIYYQHHKIETMLNLQGYGAFVTTPEGKTQRLLLEEFDLYTATERAKLWIDNNYSLPPSQLLLFPNYQEWIDRFLDSEKLLDRSLKSSKSKYKQQHYIIARLICCYFGKNQLNFFSLFLEKILSITSQGVARIFKKLQSIGLIKYQVTRDRCSESRIYQIDELSLGIEIK